MQWRDWLEEWRLMGLKIKTPFLDMEWKPQDDDRNAAWQLYAELLTRVTTQALPQDVGDEKTALDSVYSIFPTTREILKTHGMRAREFTKLAIVVLNQVVRPFTAKWHKRSLEKAFETPEGRAEFRADLGKLQPKLTAYTQMLSQMAGVEDLTALEEPGSGKLPGQPHIRNR